MADRVPRLPGDPQDHDSDDKGDQRVAKVEAKCDNDCTEHDAETDVGVSTSVVAVGHERRAFESLPGACSDERGEEVAEEADRACQGERKEMFGGIRVDDPRYRLVRSDARADEDREYDRKACVAFRSFRAQRERDAERHRRQRVSDVMDQIRQECDAAGENEDHPLRGRSQPENDKRKRYGL